MGYRMSLRLVWVSSLSAMEPGYARKGGGGGHGQPQKTTTKIHSSKSCGNKVAD